MSATFQAVSDALAADKDLQAKVMAAGSAEDRAAILKDAGVPVPSHSDVNSGHAALQGVSGAGTTTAAVAGAAAAGCE